MSEAHEKTRIRQLEDAAAHWEHKYANARQYNRNLEERCRALEKELRSLMDGVEQSDAYYVKDELTAAHAILEPQTESGTPRGEAGDRAGPLVSPHSETEVRWPVGWFQRLVMHRKLDDKEYEDYAEAFRSLGLEPDPSCREDFADKPGGQGMRSALKSTVSGISGSQEPKEQTGFSGEHLSGVKQCT